MADGAVSYYLFVAISVERQDLLCAHFQPRVCALVLSTLAGRAVYSQSTPISV